VVEDALEHLGRGAVGLLEEQRLAEADGEFDALARSRREASTVRSDSRARSRSGCSP